jgi:hypothetical protein
MPPCDNTVALALIAGLQAVSIALITALWRRDH